jgi:mitochondrial fission protein ELM1
MSLRDRADVWVLLGPHKGDNDQVLALADALSLPFRTIQMRYKWFAHLSAVIRGVTIAQLQPEVCDEIRSPWPSLVIGIGQRSVPIARYIQRASGGRTRIIRLGDPMASHTLFDLVITTTQYAVRDAANVVRLPITVTRREPVRPDREEQQWLQRFAEPRRLLVIGGKTSLWRFNTSVVSNAASALQRRAEAEGGSVIAVTSPRTSASLVAAAQEMLGSHAVLQGQFPRYGALLHAADEIHVTGDSVSMLSDAVASRKPVGLIPLEPDAIGKFVRFAGNLRGQQFRMRDLEKFWTDLRSRGLVGTVDQPQCGVLADTPVDTAAAAIRAVLHKGQKVLVPTPAFIPPQPVPEALAL